jgi:TRAP-type uncharacterized transport system fused permease subunit
MLTWTYTRPAFVVPFAFTLTPEGAGLLLQTPGLAVAWTAATAALGIAAFAAAFGGWVFAPARALERLGMGTAGSLLIFADARSDAAGLAICLVVLVLHSWRRPRFK